MLNGTYNVFSHLKYCTAWFYVKSARTLVQYLDWVPITPVVRILAV